MHKTAALTAAQERLKRLRAMRNHPTLIASPALYAVGRRSLLTDANRARAGARVMLHVADRALLEDPETHAAIMAGIAGFR